MLPNIINKGIKKHTPEDYGKDGTSSYIKAFGDIKGTTRKDIDEYIPLIPKPPSFEMALAELSSRIMNDDKNKSEDINSKNIRENFDAHSTTATNNSQKTSPSKLP